MSSFKKLNKLNDYWFFQVLKKKRKRVPFRFLNESFAENTDGINFYSLTWGLPFRNFRFENEPYLNMFKTNTPSDDITIIMYSHKPFSARDNVWDSIESKDRQALIYDLNRNSKNNLIFDNAYCNSNLVPPPLYVSGGETSPYSLKKVSNYEEAFNNEDLEDNMGSYALGYERPL